MSILSSFMHNHIWEYIWEERDECKFTIENKNKRKKDIKTLEDAWDKIQNYYT